MIYRDDDLYGRCAPATAEEFEKDALNSVSFTSADAKRILSAHKVAGRSKLSADEARAMAEARWPEDVKAALEGKVVRYRWPAAHGLRLSYAELAEVERRAGVEPLPGPGKRGAYACAEDVAKVYAAAAAYKAASHSVKVRVSFDEEDDAAAANEVFEHLQGGYECTAPSVYERRGGGAALYFEVAVPKG